MKSSPIILWSHLTVFMIAFMFKSNQATISACYLLSNPLSPLPTDIDIEHSSLWGNLGWSGTQSNPIDLYKHLEIFMWVLPQCSTVYFGVIRKGFILYSACCQTLPYRITSPKVLFCKIFHIYSKNQWGHWWLSFDVMETYFWISIAVSILHIK